MQYCKSCGASAPDDEKLCPVCGNALAPGAGVSLEKQPAGVPDGITVGENGDIVWEGECSAVSYKALFTIARWVVGILFVGAMILVLVFAEGSEHITHPLITIGITLVVYLISAGSVIVSRAGRFHGTFTLNETEARVSEKRYPPDHGVMLALYIILGILKFIFVLFLLFAPRKGSTHSGNVTDPDPDLSHSAEFRKVREVKISPDRTRIRLRKKLGSLWLIVTPGQCGFIESEIMRRRQQ